MTYTIQYEQMFAIIYGGMKEMDEFQQFAEEFEDEESEDEEDTGLEISDLTEEEMIPLFLWMN